MKNYLFKTRIVCSATILFGMVLSPTAVTYAAEDNVQSSNVTLNIQSDIKEQFNLSDSYLDSIDKTVESIPSAEQQKKLDSLFAKRMIGLDDVLALIGIIGAGGGEQVYQQRQEFLLQ